MRAFFIASLLALAAACAPAEEQEVLSDGCDTRATSQWVAGDATYSIEATTQGPDGDRAVATIVIRDSSGVPDFAEVHVAGQVMVLAGAADPAAMQTALAEWIDPTRGGFQTSSELPDWPANAEAPASGEFPFYVGDGVDRATYLDIRGRNVPMFCFVQGMESLNCLAREEGGLAHVGVQAFPG